jgi:predicted amidophosphoribosyltransferase
VLRYDKNSRRLVLGLKHGDRTHLVPAFGRWMRRAGSEILSGADLLVPVPLHWTRLFQRRYNQAALPRNLRSSVSGNVQQVSDIA